MQKMRIPIHGGWLLGLGLVAFGPADAVGFGTSHPVATLGQPLDISVPLRLDPGEELNPECVSAEVAIGDAAVPPSGVGATLVSGAGGVRAVRIRTLQRIDEPVVSVQVNAGCEQRLSRRYVVFADPPLVVAPPAIADAAPAAPPSTPPPLAGAVPSAATAVAAAAPVSRRAAAPRPRRAVARSPSPKQAAAPARARLRLDPAPVVPPPAPVAITTAPEPESMAVVAAANEAVKAAISAASASQGRIAALEAEMLRLAADAQSQREQTDRLRQRAAQAEGRNQWVWLMAVGMLALLGVAVWLWRRLRELEHHRARGWLDAAQPAAAAPAPAPVPPPSSQVPLLVERSLWSGGAGSLGGGLAPAHRPPPPGPPEPSSTIAQEWRSTPDTMALRTQPLVPQAPAAAAVEPRDVSAEELIDLEQQAEFFVVLGQDEAAIDLLVAHLRDSGGASPLPYLKLLDIYRRRGDREAYERTRDRFNHRFNAHVPGWDASAVDDRTLEDYPVVMHWLQQVWPKPLDAMAELESLLFRKDGGELFELPAYRELLMLYALARELLDGGNGGAGMAVDVLLPLNDSPGFAPTAPRPYFGDDVPLTDDIVQTAPIDLDLDLPVGARTVAEFDRLR